MGLVLMMLLASACVSADTGLMAPNDCSGLACSVAAPSADNTSGAALLEPANSRAVLQDFADFQNGDSTLTPTSVGAENGGSFPGGTQEVQGKTSSAFRDAAAGDNVGGGGEFESAATGGSTEIGASTEPTSGATSLSEVDNTFDPLKDLDGQVADGPDEGEEDEEAGEEEEELPMAFEILDLEELDELPESEVPEVEESILEKEYPVTTASDFDLVQEDEAYYPPEKFERSEPELQPYEPTVTAASDFEPIQVEAGSSKRHCREDELLSISNRSVKTVRTAPDYDASKVDWKGYIGAVEALNNREKRICVFAIRMMFHDALATAPDGPGGRWQGSDGSVLSNYEEVVLPHNTQHGESVMMRYVMERLAAYFGASWTDALTVHSSVCTELLGSSVNIADHCLAKDIPLFLNKFDFVDPISDTGFRDMETSPRPPHATAVGGTLPPREQSVVDWTIFWLEKKNEVIKGQAALAGENFDKWLFTIGDGAALMGSHTTMDRQQCSTIGEQVFFPGQKNAGCQGPQRTFVWDNQYYVDMFAGPALVFTPGVTCYESRFQHSGNGAFVETREYDGEYAWGDEYWRGFQWPSDIYDGQRESYGFYEDGGFSGDYEGSGLPRCVRGQNSGDDGFAPWEQNCEFTTHDFEEKTTNVLQAAKRRQDTLKITFSRENLPGTPFCRWFPDQEARAPCCGWECFTCGETEGIDRPWCTTRPRQANEALWLYTINDCSIQSALRLGYEDGCNERKDAACDENVAPEIKDAINGPLLEFYTLYKDDNTAWLEGFAEGQCKLNFIGSHFAEGGPLELNELLASDGPFYTDSDIYQAYSLDRIIDIILDDNCDTTKEMEDVSKLFMQLWTVSVGDKQVYSKAV